MRELFKLQFISLSSRVSQELENHIGIKDRVHNLRKIKNILNDIF